MSCFIMAMHHQFFWLLRSCPIKPFHCIPQVHLMGFPSCSYLAWQNGGARQPRELSSSLSFLTKNSGWKLLNSFPLPMPSVWEIYDTTTEWGSRCSIYPYSAHSENPISINLNPFARSGLSCFYSNELLMYQCSKSRNFISCYVAVNNTENVGFYKSWHVRSSFV